MNMRGNSGFLWKWSRYTSQGISSHPLIVINQKKITDMFTIFAIITFILASSTHAGPIYTRHRRMMREVFSDLSGEPQNVTEPDEGKCLLDGLSVYQSSVQCEKKNGCRAIQKTGYCCPDYQCECERDGKIFKNGEKLVDPGTPCKVCYCQGGEILCNSVNCYKRNDCEPKFISGRCCPEYDNCPPLDESTVKSITEQTNSPKSKPEIPNNPLGIKIKEITKPEEIRIIDEKPKNVYPTVKSNSSTDSNQSNTSESNENEKQLTTTVQENSSSEVENQNISDESTKQNTTIVPEGVNILESSDVDGVNNEDSLKFIRQTEKKKENDQLMANSTSTEEDSKQEILPQGEEVVIVDNNGQSKPILVLGVEGLQRGDIVDETNHSDAKTEKHNSNVLGGDSKGDISTSEVPGIDYEPEAAGSEIELFINKGISGNKITTEGVSEDVVSSSTNKEIYETILYTSKPELSEEKGITGTIVFDTVYHDIEEFSSNVSTQSPFSSTIILNVIPSSSEGHHPHLDDDDTIDSDPAYPPIPEEDLSNYGREVLTQPETDDYLEGIHRSKSAAQIDESKTLTNKLTTEDPLIEVESSSFGSSSLNMITTEGSLSSEEDMSSRYLYGQERSTGEPFLISKWEGNLTDAISVNETENSNEVWRDPALEIDSGSGSGLSQIMDGKPLLHKDIIEIDDGTEASADTPVHLSLQEDGNHHSLKENSDSSKSGSEGEVVSNIFDPDQQTSGLKFQKVFEVFHNFQKNYFSFF